MKSYSAEVGTRSPRAAGLIPGRHSRPTGRRDVRVGGLTGAVIAALALTGCATTQTRYVSTACITQAQFDQLKAAKPGKIHSQLNGQADHDLLPIAGRLIRVEAWGDGLLTVLGGCIDKNAH